jgi:NitT/TauT family transport system substrate-binding protein
MARTSLVVIVLFVFLAGCIAPAAGTTGQAAAPQNSPAPISAAVTTEPAPTPSAATSVPAQTANSPATAKPAGPLTKVTLAMGYIPSVQFAPLYVAQAKGYFKDAGLDVTFQYGAESDLIKLLGTNQMQFMIGSGEEVVLGRSQGLPVRYVMRWYQHFPVVIFSKADSGIRKPQDLEGKTVGIPMLSGASYVGWEALIYATKIDASKVTLQTIGFAQASTVSQNRVDAAFDYVNNGPVQLRLAGQQLNVIPISDYIDLPSNGIITNDQTIRDHPELVRALVTAALHGLSDTLADPNAAFDISLQAVPEAGGTQTQTNRAVYDASLLLWQAPPQTLGQSDPALWQTAATFMRKMGLIQQDVNPNDLYTNEFVPVKK